MPVATSTTVATLVTRTESVTTANSEAIAITARAFPVGR
jgi:hypothetical protein